MAPPAKKRKTVNDDDARTLGKLLDVAIKHIGVFNSHYTNEISTAVEGLF